MPTINDPNGTPMQVRKENANDSSGRAQIDAVIQSELEHSSLEGKNAFTWRAAYACANADTVLAVENTSAEQLSITGIWLSCDTDSIVQIHRPTTSYTTAGTNITAFNLNEGASPEATSTQDETGNTQGDIAWSGEIMATAPPFFVALVGAFILSKNKTIGVDFVTAGTVDVILMGHYLHA